MKQKPIPKTRTADKSFIKRYFAVILFAIGFLVYSNSISNNYTLDDGFAVEQNKFVQKGIGGIGEIFSYGYFYGFNGHNDQAYRPIPLVTYAIENEFAPNNPHAGHCVNIILFCCALVLMYRLLQRMLSEQPSYLPMIISLLFALHPVHTEVVDSIKSRDEILSFAFVISALLCVLQFLKTKNMGMLAGAFGLFFLSLLSKESSITIVAVVPLFIYCFGRTNRKQNLIVSSCFAIAATGYFLLRISILDAVTFDEKLIIINNTLVGADSFSTLWGTRFALLFHYLRLMLIPYPLSSDYSFSQIPIVGLSSPIALFSIALHLALFGYAVWQIIKKNVIAFGILFYLITLSLSSNFFFLIGSTFAERFLFTPSFGFCLAIVTGVDLLLKKYLAPGTERKKIITYGFTAIGLLFVIITFNRNKAWKDNYTLYSTDIEHAPNSARMQSFMATANREKGEREQNPVKRAKYFQDALTGYQQSLKIYPEFDDAKYNMGVTYYESGNPDEAFRIYKEIKRTSPKYPNVNNNIGTILFQRQQLDSALFYFQEELKLDSNYANAIMNIGAVYHNRGDYPNAIVYYERAIGLDPNNINTYNNIIKVYDATGDKEKSAYYNDQRNQLIRRMQKK